MKNEFTQNSLNFNKIVLLKISFSRGLSLNFESFFLLLFSKDMRFRYFFSIRKECKSWMVFDTLFFSLWNFKYGYEFFCTFLGDFYYHFDAIVSACDKFALTDLILTNWYLSDVTIGFKSRILFNSKRIRNEYTIELNEKKLKSTQKVLSNFHFDTAGNNLFPIVAFTYSIWSKGTHQMCSYSKKRFTALNEIVLVNFCQM